MKLLLLVVTFWFTAVITCFGWTNQKLPGAKKTELKAVVEHQAGQIQTLQAKLDSLEKKLSSTSTPVAFTVRFSQDPISIGHHQILRFDKVVTNIGGGYDAHTGIFTAPVSGVYSFFLSLMSTNSGGYIKIGIVKEGDYLDLIWAEGGSDNTDQASSQVSTHLRSGQRVWIEQHSGGAIRGSWWTIFTGYLVQAD